MTVENMLKNIKKGRLIYKPLLP